MNVTATVSGGSASTYNYTLWADCSYNGTSVSAAILACGAPTKKDDGDSSSVYTAQLTYAQSGTFYPLLIVEGGSDAIAAKKTITATLPGGSGNGSLVSCVTDACTGATFAGYFYYPGQNQMISTYCLDVYDHCATTQPTYPTGTLSNQTSYRFREGGKDLMCVNLRTPPGTCQTGSGSFSVSLSANPSSGAAPLPVSFSASVSSPDNTDTLNYSFFWDCSYAGNGGVAGAEAQCGILPTPAPGHCVSNSVGAKCDAMPPGTSPSQIGTTYTAGSYHPLVILEQDSETPALGHASVSVSNPSGNGPAPSCTLTLSKTTIAAGASSTLSWNCTNATSCTLNGSSVPTSGSQSVKPAQTTTYDLSCVDGGNPVSAQEQKILTVTGNPGLKEIAPY